MIDDLDRDLSDLSDVCYLRTTALLLPCGGGLLLGMWGNIVTPSTGVDEGGKKGQKKSSRDKHARHEPYRGGGRRSCYTCDPGSELRLGGREKRTTKKVTNGMTKKKKESERQHAVVQNSSSSSVGEKPFWATVGGSVRFKSTVMA